MLETILHNRFAVTAVLLFGIGFMNLLLQQNLLKKVVGFNIMDSAVFLLLASLGYIEGRVAPVMGEGVTPDASLFINPIPSGLVLTGIVSLKQLVNWMSTAPAERFGLARRGRLEEGYASDFTLVDLNEEYIINRNHFLSKGRNTPFHGWRVKGKIKATYVDGTCVYEEGKQ